jgi:ubiquinone/menaquinone biosynthesis C-methylase UbiE
MLPVEDGSADAAVCSLVLCSVPDQAKALAEVRRVLRPGGELRFYEHVIDWDNPQFARLQRAVDVVHPLLSGGCHLTRDTLAAILTAGFEVVSLRRFRFSPTPFARAAEPKILGCARKPD